MTERNKGAGNITQNTKIKANQNMFINKAGDCFTNAVFKSSIIIIDKNSSSTCCYKRNVTASFFLVTGSSMCV